MAEEKFLKPENQCREAEQNVLTSSHDKSEIDITKSEQDNNTKKEKEPDNILNNIKTENALCDIHVIDSNREETKGSEYIPPGITRNYKIEKDLQLDTYFKEYEVQSFKDTKIYRLRVLDLRANIYEDSRNNNHATIFLKELIRFCINYPEEIVLEDIEITKDFIAYVKKEGCCLQDKLLQDIKELNVEKIIKDVMNDIHVMENKMQLGSFSLKLENVFESVERGKYYVDYRYCKKDDDQVKKDEDGIPRKQDHESTSEKLEHYIYQLGVVMIELLRGDKVLFETYTKVPDAEIQKLACEKLVNGLNCSIQTKDLIKKMIVKDPQSRIKLDEIIEDIIIVKRSESIIPEQKFLQQNIKGYHNSVHGIVLQSSENKSIGIGTGILIGPSIVLTSGKNIYDHNNSRYYEKLEFVPDVSEKDETFFGRIGVKRCYVTEVFKSNSHRENFGIMILEKPIGEQLGYFGLHFHKSDDYPISKNTEVQLTGYIQEIENGERVRNKQIEMKGEIIAVDATDNWIAYDLESVDGSESDKYRKGLGGAGVLYEDKDGNCYVVGVHLSYDTEQQFRIGYWMRVAAFDQIISWMQNSDLPEFEKESNNESFIRTRGLKK